jgi:hypothetical protein
MTRRWPFGHEMPERRGEKDQVADGIGAQIYDGLGLFWHGKGVTSHEVRRKRRACFYQATRNQQSVSAAKQLPILTASPDCGERNRVLSLPSVASGGPLGSWGGRC